MIEPSKEAILIAMRAKGINFFAISAEEAAREIDALTAAAIQEERERCVKLALEYRDNIEAQLETGENRDVGDPERSLGKGFAANVIAKRIRGLVDRPAPEGAAPNQFRASLLARMQEISAEKDLARTRCSTPSQDTEKPGCGEIGTLTRHVSGDADGETVGYEFNSGNGRHVWCGELSKASFSELDPDQQEKLGNNIGWFIVVYERDGHHVLGKAVDEWAAERLVSIIGPALSPPIDRSGPASNTESSTEPSNG